MGIPLIVLVIFVIAWIAFYFLFLNKKTKTVIKTAIIKSSTGNVFRPEKNSIEDLTVNVIYDDDTSKAEKEVADLIIKGKDLVNDRHAIENPIKTPTNVFKKVSPLSTPKSITKLSDVNFKELTKISSLKPFGK